MRCLTILLLFCLIMVHFTMSMVLPVALKTNPCHEEGSAEDNTACANLCYTTANKCGKCIQFPSDPTVSCICDDCVRAAVH